MATATYREAERFEPRVSPSSKDPAQLVFESIPPDTPSAGSTAVFNVENGGIGNPEAIPYSGIRASDTPSAGTTAVFNVENGGIGNPEAVPYGGIKASDETRALRQRIAGTNPYNWPMKETVSNPYNWPTIPHTDSPVVPPKPPSLTYEIAVDDGLPLRPVQSRSFGRASDEDRRDNADVRPIPLRQAGVVATSDRSITSATLGSAPSLRSLANSAPQPVESARSTPSRRMPPPPSITTDGRVVIQSVPSPPLPSSSSVDSVQSSPPILNSSIRPVASMRPFIDTHVRQLSPEGLAVETPVVEAGSPMTPHPALDSSSSHFPPPASQASSSPPRSPPPPYSHRQSSRRRRDSYYAMAEARSDQIMSNSSPPTSARPPLRKDMPSSASSAPTVNRAAELSSVSPPSPHIQAPRPLSASSVMTDDTLGTETMGSVLQVTQSAPLSVFPESSPPKPAYPGARQYRPSSAASAPAEESRSRTFPSSSAAPVFNKHGRSYSIPATMVEHITDLTLRPTESAPAGIRRKPVPLGTKVTDTYKEAVSMEPPFDTSREASFRAPLRRPPQDSRREINIDPSIVHRPRPLEIRQRLTDTSKEMVSDLPVEPQIQHLTDTSKEIVPDPPVEPQIQVSPPAQPTSHVAMIRKKNMERKQQAGRRRLRIVNA